MSMFKGAFSFKKTKPRKFVSKSPLKLPADQLQRDLGPRCEVIDIRVADQKITFDIENGDWNTGNDRLSVSSVRGEHDRLGGAESLGGTASSSSARNLRQQVEVLHEENNMLKVKVDMLLNLVAESIAELRLHP